MLIIQIKLLQVTILNRHAAKALFRIFFKTVQQKQNMNCHSIVSLPDLTDMRFFFTDFVYTLFTNTNWNPRFFGGDFSF